MTMDELRGEIDAVDRALLAAFLGRMALVDRVARYKQAKDLPLTDKLREEAILRRVDAEAGDYAPEARSLFQHLIALSTARQARLQQSTEPLFGLIGEGITHSLSPALHRAFGNPAYRLIELAPDELGGFLQGTLIGGLNVTMPYKRAVLPYCTALTPRAEAIGSVNTLLPLPDGGLLGDNTDAWGFAYMARRAGIALGGRKVLLLGRGGGSLAVRCAAEAAGARQVVAISCRGPESGGNLSEHGDAEILVNATPVGMYPEAGVSPVDLAAFPRCIGVLDLIYNPLQTALLRQAEVRGIPHSGGLPMLVAQGAAAAEQFLNRTISEAEVEAVLQKLQAARTNLVLIGMPGCGKSTVGKALAVLTGRAAVDLDEKLADAAGMPAADFLTRHGEGAFRTLERRLAARYGAEGGQVLITGGGVVTSPENAGALRQNGRVYHLLRPLEALSREGRPLSEGADLVALWAKRLPLYEGVRHAAVENHGTPEEAAAHIWAEFCRHFGVNE